MNWNEFKNNVESWATERGIYEHSTPEAQLLKALSELGELADAVIKNDRDGLKDAIGDVAVCLVNYEKMVREEKGIWCEPAPTGGATANSRIGDIAVDIGLVLLNNGAVNYSIAGAAIESLQHIASKHGLDFMYCCKCAWREIKDRKGRMAAGGAFVKDN